MNDYLFYAFLKRAINNPSILDKNAGELKAILNQIRLLNKPGELEAILPGLRELHLVTPKIHNTASTVIAEIERNIKNVVKKSQVEKVNILHIITGELLNNKARSSYKQQKAVMDFIKG